MNWKIDPTHSTIEFSVKHMMFTTVRGRFGEFDGTVEINSENLLASKAEGTIDLASIDSRDQQRDAHLRSADFFDVENYPQMSFRSTRIEALDGNEYEVYGDLTIKGTTREVAFDVVSAGRGQDPWGNQRWGLSASTKL